MSDHDVVIWHHVEEVWLAQTIGDIVLLIWELKCIVSAFDYHLIKLLSKMVSLIVILKYSLNYFDHGICIELKNKAKMWGFITQWNKMNMS